MSPLLSGIGPGAGDYATFDETDNETSGGILSGGSGGSSSTSSSSGGGGLLGGRSSSDPEEDSGSVNDNEDTQTMTDRFDQDAQSDRFLRRETEPFRDAYTRISDTQDTMDFTPGGREEFHDRIVTPGDIEDAHTFRDVQEATSPRMPDFQVIRQGGRIGMLALVIASIAVIASLWG